MELFIDTADVNEIEAAQSMGLLDGVTTNPSLVAKTGRGHREVLVDICERVSGPVSAEVHGTTYDVMMEEARELAAIAPNIVVKIPLIEDGMRAVKSLTEAGVKTNVTLCFSPLQALLAAKAGATYISPFVGRLDDIGHDGMGLVEQICDMYERYDLDTKVLVASVRSPSHVVESLRIGADVATIPFGVIGKLIRHPLTDIGLARFLEDAKAIPK
ncbi:transaldolase, putative [Plesiocystis pacifica SIR-1]|uniref:Probable transaldolase n=1 Tax=Plesiocystis pacifica SIR-1 TaxID=391625 RepID=A6G306_9BACT|nr:fructose-6-phosphate aldolase [Plesiocystis pacifica]EDM79856.1 transaldolase, putative [Plesiocystis pacifica SIR-1]